MEGLERFLAQSTCSYMVDHYHEIQLDSEELQKASHTPGTSFGMTAGTLEQQVIDEWYFCQSAGENKSEFSIRFSQSNLLTSQ